MNYVKDFFIKHLGRLQNLLIMILCITVVYQLTHLWFINLSNGHFMYSINEKSVALQENKQDFISPMRILNSQSYNIFDVVYEGESYNNMLSIYIKILKTASDKASYMDTGNGLDKIYENRNLTIFDYPISISGDMLCESIGVSKNNYSKIKIFDKVGIVITDGLFNIYFINTDEETYYYYVLNDSDLLEKYSNSLNEIKSDITYSYQLNEQSRELVANIDESFEYNYVIRNNPFTTVYGDSPRNLVESKVDKYFRNVLHIKFLPSDTAYVFSDADTVVKYFNSGLFEYSYYDVMVNSYEYSIVEDYAIAVDFINEDEDIVNDYYLKNYYRNNFETVFEFSYVVNNYPVIYETENGYCDTAIIITIKNNTVTNFKKTVYNFEISDNKYSAQKSFDEAIGIFESEDYGDMISNIKLGYKTYENSNPGEGEKSIEKEAVTKKEVEKNISVDKTREPKREVTNKTRNVKEEMKNLKHKLDTDTNETQTRVGNATIDKNDEPLKIEVTENKTEKLPNNKTHQVLVKETTEKLPSNGTIREKSVENKTVSDKGEVEKDIEEETVILKEEGKNVTKVIDGMVEGKK